MYQQLVRVCQRIWPELAALPEKRRAVAVGDILGALYALPIAAAGLVWLSLSSEWQR